jgi:hypothetical protein
MELKDIVQPKWVAETKRGWGMILTFAGTVLPMVNMWVQSKTGVAIDAPMVALFGEAVNNVISSVGTFVGVCLWVWGSFRPTAPVTLMPRK